MGNNITKDELAILAYLHEHATGFDDQHWIDWTQVFPQLQMSDGEFRKSASYLQSHGLIGFEWNVVRGYIQSGVRLNRIWLTGDGENFMRELENQPGIARKITTKTASIIYDTAREIVVKVLGDFLSGRI